MLTKILSDIYNKMKTNINSLHRRVLSRLFSLIILKLLMEDVSCNVRSVSDPLAALRTGGVLFRPKQHGPKWMKHNEPWPLNPTQTNLNVSLFWRLETFSFYVSGLKRSVKPERKSCWNSWYYSGIHQHHLYIQLPLFLLSFYFIFDWYLILSNNLILLIPTYTCIIFYTAAFWLWIFIF